MRSHPLPLTDSHPANAKQPARDTRHHALAHAFLHSKDSYRISTRSRSDQITRMSSLTSASRRMERWRCKQPCSAPQTPADQSGAQQFFFFSFFPLPPPPALVRLPRREADGPDSDLPRRVGVTALLGGGRGNADGRQPISAWGMVAGVLGRYEYGRWIPWAGRGVV
ncbi:uncharacterized protein K452DRAFT_116939 [Aplosporella prunicola CBS 121167]|uniref:Uncharacterized protein n=1 Tax=Aplosporella prunicola CBS 121167 TaxID=1176127 RepID=A0A6A6B1L6_9PEZI|nr:uncharacterized protein K452DRAFT_116939 [Aplosporella prunicola CBS 121167]KAF2136907.1 hypothetical protein K452DRAFT_116939 [Aplosporella prunicola CBS 121167]